ncbi:DUF1801 domain-containing protein [Massilia glaciei]|uniref:DUF1801 domain-containing protein n=1 Tax=Massilia glaciei TaxID=1524097 RepID=A0A2U2HIW5_9BURK|nr:DUF1801 domain-containing protein [Massilia glaciei]PWF46755.1 DUF1801 domain-containing protein [Massilia glaciei]
MQSKANSVADYLEGLAPERRALVEALRAAVRSRLDPQFSELMQYGMIGYCVPHSVFAPGYHCDPKQPLPYAGIASQKNHVSLYLMGLYCGGGGEAETAETRWFREAWAGSGKKLDMGKGCVRFKKLDDIAFEVVAEAIARVPAQLFIARYLATRSGR